MALELCSERTFVQQLGRSTGVAGQQPQPRAEYLLRKGRVIAPAEGGSNPDLMARQQLR